MPKMVFIEPKAPNLHIFSKFSLPRLGSFILATILKNKGWEVEVIVEERQKIKFENLAEADLVGISTITPTAPRAYAIADRIREMNVPVIMGGPHVTFLAEEALEHADFVIRGEGEEALCRFVQEWCNGGHYEHVPGLSYWKKGRMVHNEKKGMIADLDRLPFPDYALSRKPFFSVASRSVIPIQTSRGCPFDCSFCSVTGMFGKKYRYRSIGNIIRELKQYDSKKNIIFFYDDNFTANRKHAKELLHAMIEEKFKFKWSTQVRVDIARDLELVKLMKKAGCHTLYIGFESVNPESLKSMKKEQTVEEIIEAVKVLQRHRIHIHGMFVYGFDDDDWATVKQTVRFAKRVKLTSTQFLILTPLPGSEFYDQMVREERIQFHDWNLYDAHHVVFRPKRFSLLDLQRAQIFSHRSFYSFMETIKRFFTGRWLSIALAHYARNLNRMWNRKNKIFMRAITLMKPNKKAHISLDYHETVVL